MDPHFDGNVGPNAAYGTYGNGTTVVIYGSLSTGQPYYPDPLASIPESVSASAACGGGSATTHTQASFAASTWTPGIYEVNNSGPAIFTGNTTLSDCGSGNPGVYSFPHGVVFEGDLAGSDVLLYSQGKINPKNVCTDSTQANDGGALLNEPYIGSSSGVNLYGFMFTGSNSVTLSARNSGLYTNLALFQSRTGPGHIGFQVYPGDSGNISLTGTVYAHNINHVPNNPRNVVSVSNTCNNPGGSWCTAGNGSAMVFGTDDGAQDGHNYGPKCWTRTPMTCTWPNCGGGNLTLDGAAVVDVFYTPGNANVKIECDTNHVPLLGARLVQ